MCDKVIHEDQEYLLYCEPLEMFWDDPNPKPDFIPPHTACWRGYIASWMIQDGRLFLAGIETENEHLKMDSVFPGKKSPIFADWFSGRLRIPQGEMLQYIHMGYESRYESDLFLFVENGTIINQELVVNR
jgi:hypothetical protein